MRFFVPVLFFLVIFSYAAAYDPLDQYHTIPKFRDMERDLTYSQILARKYPSYCVSLSSFYNDTIIPCPSCIKSDKNIISLVGVKTRKEDNTPLLQCTRHMCPVRVHWHVQLDYNDYWRVKVSITNFNYLTNYTLWTLVIQHPNLNNVTQVFSFDYKPLVPYESINDTGMFSGLKFFNDQLLQAGQFGSVQSEMLLKKDKNTFTFKEGSAFPRKVYSNGDECQLPPPDAYPFLPNSAHDISLPFSLPFSTLTCLFIFMFITIWLFNYIGLEL